MSESSPVRYTFSGAADGQYLAGVPARDLTDDDVFHDMTVEQKNLLKTHLTGDGPFLYTRVKPAKGEKGADITKHDTDLDVQPDLIDQQRELDEQKKVADNEDK